MLEGAKPNHKSDQKVMGEPLPTLLRVVVVNKVLMFMLVAIVG